jgi:hypothetical protein
LVTRRMFRAKWLNQVNGNLALNWRINLTRAAGAVGKKGL